MSIKTTGTDVRYDRLTEIALFAYERENLTMRLHSLLCSGSSGQSSSLSSSLSSSQDTGIPHFYEIAKNLLEHTQNMTFVSHNARFVYSFICKAYENLGFTYTRNKICTKNLAKEIHPELPSYALNDLCRHLKLEVPDTGDVVQHARSTALLFKSLLERKENSNYTLRRKAKFPAGLTLKYIDGLPDKPGVYYFKDLNDEVIYVGKSIHIKKRIAQHFVANTRKAAKLQQNVAQIEYELTTNDLEAELLEVYRIREFMPRLNRAMRTRREAYGFTIEQNGDGYLSFRVRKLSRFSDLDNIFTFSSRAAAEGMIWALIEEYTLCAKISGLERSTESCFNHSVKKCLGACIGEEKSDTYNDRVREALLAINRLPEAADLTIPSDYANGHDLLIKIRNRRFYAMATFDEEGGRTINEQIFEPSHFADRVLLKYLIKHRREFPDYFEEE